jgi:hypothetical protein
MRNLQSLLATALMLLMMTGCAGPVLAQTHMDNPKFMRHEETVLGLNETELIEALGKPKNIEEAGCAVPFMPDPKKEPVPVVGNAWTYLYETNEVRAGMHVCVVNKHAVGEQRELGLKQGGRTYYSTQAMLDADLIEKAFRGELGESSHEERTAPPYEGPEYAI